MLFYNRLVVIGFAFALALGQLSYSEETTPAKTEKKPKKQADEVMLAKTLGSRRFWGDVYNFRGWRIQQNVSTKQYRLIDSKGDPLQTGSYDECQSALNEIREEKKLAQVTGPAVILIHGLL